MLYSTYIFCFDPLSLLDSLHHLRNPRVTTTTTTTTTTTATTLSKLQQSVAAEMKEMAEEKMQEMRSSDEEFKLDDSVPLRCGYTRCQTIVGFMHHHHPSC